MAGREPKPPAPTFDTKELTLVIRTDGGFRELPAIARLRSDGPWLIQQPSGDEPHGEVRWKVMVRLHECRSSRLLAFLEVEDATAYLQGRAPWYSEWERLLRPFPDQAEPLDHAETKAFLEFVKCCQLEASSAEAWDRAHEYGPLRHSLEVFGGYSCSPKKTPAAPDQFHVVTPNMPAGEGLTFVPLSCRWRGTAKLEDRGKEIWASTAQPGTNPQDYTCEELPLDPSSADIVAYTS